MMINVFLLGFILLAAAATSLPVHADRGLVVVTASSSIDEVATRDVENAKDIAKSIGLSEANLRFMIGKELRKEAVKEAALKIASELKTDERFYFFLSAPGVRYQSGETCKVGVILSNTDKPRDDDVVTPEEFRSYLGPAISKSLASFLIFDAMEIGNFSQEIIKQSHINYGRLDPYSAVACGGFRTSQIETIPKVFSDLIASNKNHILMLGGFGDEALWDSPRIGGLFSRSLALCLDPTLSEVRTESLVKCTQSSMNNFLASLTSREVLSSTVQFFGSKSLTTVLGVKSRENQDKGPVIASSPPI